MTYIISGFHRSSHVHQDGKACEVCTVALNNSIIRLIVCPLQSLSRPRPTPKPTCIQSNTTMLWKLRPQWCHKFKVKLWECYLQSPLTCHQSPRIHSEDWYHFHQVSEMFEAKQSLYLATKTVICIYSTFPAPIESLSKHPLNVTQYLTYQYEVNLHGVL